MLSKKERGNLGEELVARYYKEREYEVIGRNIYVWRGEIDIILRKEKKYYFIEVKTVTKYASAWSNFGWRKRESLISSIEQYCQKSDISEYRINFVIFLQNSSSSLIYIYQI